MKCMPKRRLAAGVVLALSFLAPLGFVAAQTLSDQGEEDYRRIANGLMCQCGCGYLVHSCNHLDCPSATVIRKTIRRSLAEGQGEQAILASFVEEYGPRILPEPPRQGFTWLGWIMPFVALALGAGAVGYVLWRWQAGPGVEDEDGNEDEIEAVAQADAPAALPQSAALVEKYRAQIDSELERD